jgi:hypothetical protein
MGTAQQSGVSGTSFLDLPPELREMIYDLCTLKRATSCHTVPFKSKPMVTGINLLRCSKQVHNEVSHRLRLWDAVWSFLFILPSVPMEPNADMNSSLAVSHLHNCALAKIKNSFLEFKITTDTASTFDVRDLEFLLELKSVWFLHIFVDLKSSSPSIARKQLSDLENMLVVTGLVVCVLSHIPASVFSVEWYLYQNNRPLRGNDTLSRIAEQYKYVRGSAYTAQQNSGSS